MNDQDKVIIDENLENTFGVLNNDPSIFRVKDYAGNLPDDYADDFAYALFESCLTYDSKYTLTHLVLKECRNEEAGTEIENKRFVELCQVAKDANPNCKNGYLPMFFAYIQLVAEEPGITEGENKALVAKLLNIIEQDKKGLFPQRLYKKDEYEISIGLETPIPSESFLTELKDFYQNLITNPASNKVYDKHAVDTTLNQYLDDIYSLTYTDEDKELSWFERTDKILTIQKQDSEDKSFELMGNTTPVNFAELYNKILKGFVEYPIYQDGKYDFSYFSSSANLLANNLNGFIMVYNTTAQNKIELPEMDLPEEKQKECLESYNTFIASYITALIAEKYDLENPENDPDKLLDPNLKVNLLKANENIFSLGLSEGKTNEEITAKVKELISIAKRLMNFAENEQFTTEENEETTQELQTLEQPTQYDISSSEVCKHMLTYLKKQQKAYVAVCKELQKIKGHKENGRNYKNDDEKLAQYAGLYAPEMTKVDIDKLSAIMERKADKLYIAIDNLRKRASINKLAGYIELYNAPAPVAVKNQEISHMDWYIRKTLEKNNCDENTIQTCINIIHETMKSMPLIKDAMNQELANKKFTFLKANEALKKAIVFSSVISDVMYLNRENNNTTYRFIESIMPHKSLRLEQKYVVKDYVRDAIFEVAANLNRNSMVAKDIVFDLHEIARKFDDTQENSCINNGLISKQDKTEVLKQLKAIYAKLPKQVKEDKNHAASSKLAGLIPDLIKKIPTTKEAAASMFTDFICEFVTDSEKASMRVQVASDLKKIVKDIEVDPYGLKSKYSALVPEELQEMFEELWKALPRVTTRARDKYVLESAIRQIIAKLPKDQRTKYLTYFSRLFSRGANTFVAQNQVEKDEIEKYLSTFKESFVQLLEGERNNTEFDIDELLNILNKYAVTSVDVEDGSEDSDENN